MNGRTFLLILAGAIAAALLTGQSDGVVTLLLFLLVLGSLVVIHELGHFITARLAGVRVLEFGIGFPPRAKVLRSSGDTLYTLNWLPIGGFVKLEGEDGDDTDDPRSFVNASLAKRLTILAAGVGMNILLAFAIFTAIALVATPYVGVQFFEVTPNSPAQKAGLQPGDAIVAIDGERFEYFGGRTVIDGLREHHGQLVKLTIAHPNGQREDIPVQLRDEAPGQGVLGISQATEPWKAYFLGEYTGHDVGTAIATGAATTRDSLGLILDGLGQLVGSVASNPTQAPPVAGPVGIAIQIGQVFRDAGPIMTLYVAGILSANLALVNILPFPPLDGGRMLIMVLKSLFGRRISLQAERLTYMVGFVFLFAFLIWITGFDIIRGLQGG
jgi:regulator of sigma E protease